MNNFNRKFKTIAKFALMIEATRRPGVRNECFHSTVITRLGDLDRKIHRAKACGLKLAESKLSAKQSALLWDLNDQLGRYLRSGPSHPFFLDIHSAVKDLQSLDENFLATEFCAKDRSISVITKPIELSNRILGRFKICLQLPKDTTQKCKYRVFALDDEYCSSDGEIAHPHIQSDILCEGDASGAIARSLEQGRVLDFFLIVNSVLGTYNSESAYRRLDEWSDLNCSDCGDSTDPSDISTCAECSARICEYCVTRCRTCDEYHCGECVSPCSACLEQNCDDCNQLCAECDQRFCSDCFSNKDLCKRCQEDENNDQVQAQQSDTAVHTDSLGEVAVPA